MMGRPQVVTNDDKKMQDALDELTRSHMLMRKKVGVAAGCRLDASDH